MKIIKIILGIITALTIVFFATGLFVKETNYTTQVSVNKPLEEVFTTFNNQENLKEWIPEIKSFEVINETLGRTGNTYKIVVVNQGQEITMTEKVMAYIPNEKVTLFFDAENMLKTDDYIFTTENELTTVTLNSSCRSDSYIMSCLFPYFKGTFKRQDQDYLNNFKSFVEKQ
ncbi:SRPBCC family protein [Polaribacter vadi]|uniref:SRPBCC family protein n=1 Tax=Polaribacter TaxID=52959 RepID=UPI001C093D21|nr:MULTISPECIES: SRPBCC family protein [Polaribacter]MBU3013032.1 SRPBCC family protein [Polaribacter vadi]MDO6742850.1 SRPBCC family protein [Polaribacter sp. 1_MG-2023]